MTLFFDMRHGNQGPPRLVAREERPRRGIDGAAEDRMKPICADQQAIVQRGRRSLDRRIKREFNTRTKRGPQKRG